MSCSPSSLSSHVWAVQHEVGQMGFLIVLEGLAPAWLVQPCGLVLTQNSLAGRQWKSNAALLLRARIHSKNPETREDQRVGRRAAQCHLPALAVALRNSNTTCRLVAQDGTCQLPSWMGKRLLRSHTSCAATGKLMISREGKSHFLQWYSTGWCPCSRK